MKTIFLTFVIFITSACSSKITAKENEQLNALEDSLKKILETPLINAIEIEYNKDVKNSSLKVDIITNAAIYSHEHNDMPASSAVEYFLLSDIAALKTTLKTLGEFCKTQKLPQCSKLNDLTRLQNNIIKCEKENPLSCFNVAIQYLEFVLAGSCANPTDGDGVCPCAWHGDGF